MDDARTSRLHIVVHAVIYMVLNAAHAILLHALSVLMDITSILMVIVRNLPVQMGRRWITLAAFRAGPAPEARGATVVLALPDHV